MEKRKTFQHHSFYNGFWRIGLPRSAQIWRFSIKLCSPKSFWILAPFFPRFLIFVEHFGSHFGSFLEHFWRLGVTLGDFGETLGIAGRQIGALGCSWVALESSFGFKLDFGLIFARFWRPNFAKIVKICFHKSHLFDVNAISPRESKFRPNLK